MKLKKAFIWWFFISFSISCLHAGETSKKGESSKGKKASSPSLSKKGTQKKISSPTEEDNDSPPADVNLEEPGTPIIEEKAVEPELSLNRLRKVPYEIISNILKYMHITDVSNFMKSQNHADTERAEKFFLKSLNDIRDYQKLILKPTANITMEEYRKKLLEDAIAFVKAFTPDQGDITAHMCILSFKFIVPLSIARYAYVKGLSANNLYDSLNKGMDVYLKSAKFKLIELEAVAGVLTFTDHIYIIRFLLDKSKIYDMSAACFIYLRILQMSPESVKKWLSVYATQKVKLLEDMANGYYALHELSATKPKPKDANFEPKPHLNLKWEDFCEHPPSPESQEKLKSQNAKLHMVALDTEFQCNKNTSIGLHQFATVYCAMHPLEGTQFGNSAKDGQLNLLLFDLGAQSPIVARLNSLLRAKCKNDTNCKALETDFEHQNKAMTELIGGLLRNTTENAVSALKYGETKMGPEFWSKTGDLLKDRCMKINSEKGMIKYIDLLKKFLALGNVNSNSFYYTMAWLFDGFFRIMQDCGFLKKLLEKKLDLFQEAEQLHSQLTIRSSLSNKLSSYLASKLQKKFGYLLKPKKDDDRKSRDQQAIILKFALTYLAEELSESSNDLSSFVRTVSECFYTLAAMDPESISNPISVFQWNRFNKRIYSYTAFTAIHSQVTNGSDTNNKIAFVHRPLNAVSNKSPVVYLAHWNILFATSRLQDVIDGLLNENNPIPNNRRFLYDQLAHPEQLIKNMRELEKNINKAMPNDPFILEEYMKRKFYFHHFFMNRTRREQNINVKEFVETEIEVICESLLTEKFESAYPYMRMGILYNIFVAITENADTVDTLGVELIEKVDQLAFNLMCQYREYFNKNPYLEEQLGKYKAVVESFLKKQSNAKKLK